MSDVELRVYAPPADQFDNNGYPVAWQRIKHAVREEAGHRCVRCGHPFRVGGQYGSSHWSPCDDLCRHDGPTREVREPGDTVRVEAEWRILTVHHLTGDKADCRWWNLAALCQRCHLTIQGKVVMNRRWLHVHSAWFQPYAAGWYAWHFLREEITRVEAIERLPELLALECRQLDFGDV
jgi:5-methylcytosine-specific restriction endonuclease McrA